MYRAKSYIKIATIILLVFISFYNQDTIIENAQEKISNLSQKGESGEKYKIRYNLNESLSEDIEVTFCPQDNCFEVFNESFSLAKEEIKCAFYELDENRLANTLLKRSDEIGVELIVDDNYLEEESIDIIEDSKIKLYSDANRGTRYNNYMHNKFCVIDDSMIISGSTNPTDNGLYKNNNNIIKISSALLARNFKNEFDQLASGNYGSEKISVLEYNNLTLRHGEKEYVISSYMCPQDECSKEIIRILEMAKEEIIFAAFAITHDGISDKLVEKSLKGVDVRGIIEKRNTNLRGSDATRLREHFNVYNDTSKYNMHHKFYVIDNRFVITGSMNPSASGDDYNDENILIIDSVGVADMYREEFLSLIGG